MAAVARRSGSGGSGESLFRNPIGLDYDYQLLIIKKTLKIDYLPF